MLLVNTTGHGDVRMYTKSDVENMCNESGLIVDEIE